MPVVGTAGHVDHGKTLLIQALTGIDTDRIPEEKRRGMTIDLGFAHFSAPSGQIIGVIDVPGHEKYIRNMVAGAYCLDVAMLVIAADDGWMPQTESHAWVLSVFSIPRVVVVLSKIDLVTPDRVEEVSQQVKEHCFRIFQTEVPIVKVSARTGQGLEELKHTLLEQLELSKSDKGSEAESLEKDTNSDGSPFRLYLDRVFTIKGQGTIVAGSLKGASIRVDEELLLLPQEEKVRIRKIQSYGREYKEVKATLQMGAVRVAMNLQGFSSPPQRGDCLVSLEKKSKESPYLTKEILAVAHLFYPLKAQQEVELAYATDHRIVHIYLLQKGNLKKSLRLPFPIKMGMEEGERGGGIVPLRGMFKEPVPLWPQDRFILIRQGGSEILGWGEVLYTLPTTGKEREWFLQLFHESVGPFLPVEQVEAAIKGYSSKPGVLARLKQKEGELLTEALEEKKEPSQKQRYSQKSLPSFLQQVEGWLFRKDIMEHIETEIKQRTEKYRVISLPEVSKQFGLPLQGLKTLVDWLLKQPKVQETYRETITRKGDEIICTFTGASNNSLSPNAQEIWRKIQAAGNTPWEREGLKGEKEALDQLCKANLLVPLEGDLFLERGTYLHLVEQILKDHPVGKPFTIGEAKAASRLSRKYILPLLNRMERDGWVKRRGDNRVILRKGGYS
ncbi:MAG: selenocysteine-specific translation elongation factor [Spirochaetales bacterium]